MSQPAVSRLLAGPRRRLGRLAWRLRALLRRERPPERLRLSVVASYPHDPGAFTQGLVWADGCLYESTGGYGASSLRRVDLATGRVDAIARLPEHLFGEGIARAEGRLVQLTWRERRALVWDMASLELLDQLPYDGEGWGLCSAGPALVASDGTDALTFRDPDRLAPLSRVTVTDRGWPVRRLNDLELADGAIYANLWKADRLLRVDPSSGRVTGVVDASALLAGRPLGPEEVLNGIARVPSTGHLLVTGKGWPLLFEVAVERDDRA